MKRGPFRGELDGVVALFLLTITFVAVYVVTVIDYVHESHFR